MYADTLYQILLFVLIVGGAFLVMVLWRLYRVLTDVEVTVSRVSKRVEQVDNTIDVATSRLKSVGDMILGFVGSVGGDKAKIIINDFWKEKNNSKEE